MENITEGVYMTPGIDEMIPDSHMYLLGMPDSKDLTLVDAGLVGKGDYKIKSILDSGIALEDIKRIIMTHTHLDHTGCLHEFFSRMPWVELWVHESEGEQLEKGDERTLYGMAMFKSMCQSQYRLKDGDYKLKVHRKLVDGDVLKIGGMTWNVIHIPGHSMGCIALYEPTEKILIPGDVVYADHDIGRFDLYGADPKQHLDSLKLLSEIDVKILLPGHNRIMNSVPDGYIKKTVEQWKGYLK
jgi:hydroxyacylglutathione hydrolase